MNIARVTLPVFREVLTPTILETELGFLRKLIVNRICCTDLVVARFMVATCDVREQLDMVTPEVDFRSLGKNETYRGANRCR